MQTEETKAVMYDDDKYVKRNRMASYILLIKAISTIPFNIIGLYKPEYIVEREWILFIEAFHHYHARIFYLLALHRNMTQLYCCKYTNGRIQRRFILLEAFFDIGLVCLYIHEYFGLHNVQVFMTPYTAIHCMIAILSVHSLRITNNIKYESIA